MLVLEKGLVAETWPSRVPLMSGNPTSKDFKGAVWASVPQPHADNRSLRIVRGEALGGATRVNGMLYTRGQSSGGGRLFIAIKLAASY